MSSFWSRDKLLPNNLNLTITWARNNIFCCDKKQLIAYNLFHGLNAFFLR